MATEAKTVQPGRPPVSFFTAHVGTKEVELVVTGQHGTLALQFRADEPSIDFPDWERDAMAYKAVCHLVANGRTVGWFVEKKGATKSEDTIVWFPEGRRREVPRPPVTPSKAAPPKRRAKKGERR